MKKVLQMIAGSTLAVTMAMGLVACAKDNSNTESDKSEFVPRLDTEKTVTLDIAGFLGNFEALDQVINSFNEYYPDVTISYEQNGDSNLAEYMKNNEYVDIFMTTDTNIRYETQPEKYVGEYCVDLNNADIDLSDIQPEMLEACMVDGKLLRLPIAQDLSGMVVNETLLKKEGLEIPENYQEFIQACEVLKKKGYVPIQSAITHAGSDMTFNMAMTMIGNDKELAKGVADGDKSAIEKLRPVFEKLKTFKDNGYIDNKVNKNYPDDNYDQAILTFFEGNVPFWMCDTENASGMKKRESKSDAFSKNPFEYKFMYVPLGDEGVYEYRTPWYGFSVNEKSDSYEYALEFMRFIAAKDQINTLASVKGLPSVAVNSEDEKYSAIYNPEAVESEYVNDGSIEIGIETSFADVINNYCNDQYESIDEALEALCERCSL